MVCFLWQHEIYFVIFTRYRMPLLEAFSCRPSVSPEPSAARMPLLILWLSPTGYCCRERQNSIFVLKCTSGRAWFLYSNMRSKLVGLRRTRTRYFWRVLVWYAHFCRTLYWYEAKEGFGVVSCTTFSYLGACWSEVIVLIWYHMCVWYVRIVTFKFSLKYLIFFVSAW